jgi:hypothetical protein
VYRESESVKERRMAEEDDPEPVVVGTGVRYTGIDVKSACCRQEMLGSGGS